MQDLYLKINDLLIRNNPVEIESVVMSTPEPVRTLLEAYVHLINTEYERSKSLLNSVEPETQTQYAFKEILLAKISLVLKEDLDYPQLFESIQKSMPDIPFLQLLLLMFESDYYRENNPIRSLSLKEKVHHLGRKIGDNYFRIMADLEAGTLYRYMTNFTNSRDIYLELLDELHDVQIPIIPQLVYANLGYTYFYLGDHRLAMKFLYMAEEIGITTISLYIQILFLLFYIYIRVGDYNMAGEYRQKIHDIVPENPSSHTTSIVHLTDGIYLKSSNRIMKKAQGQAILQEIVRGEIFDYEGYYYAIINLIELLISEVSQTNAAEVFEEINSLLDRLEELYLQNEGYIYKLEIIQIQARILFIKDDIEGALNLLDEKIKFYKDKLSVSGLISTKEEIVQQINEWADKSRKNKDIIEKINKSQLLEYLHEVSKIIKQ